MQPANTGGYRRRYLDLVVGLVEMSGSNWGNAAGAGNIINQAFAGSDS